MALLEEGEDIRGAYVVERFLGEGAFAEVYRVRHRFLGRQAMKVFKRIGMSVQETEEMLSEAIILSRISHPNIIHVFNADVAETARGSCGYFTMEYVAGGSLDQFWKSHGSRFVPVETVVEIMRQVCRGLAVAHGDDPPIIHRDIKPQNILIGYDAAGVRARVSDFGLAKHVNPLTLMASARGTRCFKAPEVFRDPSSDSRAGDVWALGMTMYLLLTDRLPFATDRDDNIDPRMFEQPVTPPSKWNIGIDSALDSIACRALDAQPNKRYPTAIEMLEALEQWRPQSAKAPIQKFSSSSKLSVEFDGGPSPNEQEGKRLAAEALRLAQQITTLAEAADAMEEAFNRWPELRLQHEHQVKLWRRGIMM
jgi:serine/threonine protein kinase